MNREDLPSLLLLPYPPNPLSCDALEAAYRPPLRSALGKVKRASAASKLIVAVAWPGLHGQFLYSKTLSWTDAQALVAGIYGILSVVCAQLGIGTEVDGGPNSVDTTVVLIDDDRAKRYADDFRPSITPNNTAIIDMPTFASAFFPWNRIFSVRTELGFQVFQTYLRLAEGRQTLLQKQLVHVEGGLTLSMAKSSTVPAALPPQSPSYPVVCLGGTFDYLHPGHKLLLTAGALLLRIPRMGAGDYTPTPCRYIIGVTGDEMLRNKKFAEYVQPWEVRARNVIYFLAQLLELRPRGWKDGARTHIDEQPGKFTATFRERTIEIQCVIFQDIYGPTVAIREIEALIVSGETRAGGRAVNEKRISQGWLPLVVYEVDVLDAKDKSDEDGSTENFATKISSSTIRQQRAARGGMKI
ncbi:hypothetical protein C8A05DRAFT_17033 [Staphylotrichum tortipilum]|uniref:Pantetheine-phosphate adenylyltransferase family protein n=1 Tax=Staphylotrichum tortipilum TaxID=2831512 RepID=A0AAN6MID9_9PEZI|nr:hypothetical protein C8A05DRAFT_17033 [Staphylotrichum longicolle]